MNQNNKLNISNETKILNTPENNAAIYARISSQKDNNSIDAQVEMAKEMLYKKKLFTYGVYTDHISGLSTPPAKRPAFKKLLVDAESGCFKTLIIYRLDRLVRNYDDWIEIKSILSNLGIKIIFSDPSQEIPTDSPQSEFLQNLTVMVAQMEPGTISSRATTGKQIRRKNGIYTAPKYTPFGYFRSKNKTTKEKSLKAEYKQNSIECAFIKYLFSAFTYYLKYNPDLTGNSIKPFVASFFESTVKSFNDNTLVRSKLEFENYFIDCLLAENTDYDTKAKTLSHISDFFDFSGSKTGNFLYALTNNIYSGYMFSTEFNYIENSDKDLTPTQYEFLTKYHVIYTNGFLSIDRNSLILANNIKGCIDFNTFEKVFLTIITRTFKRIDTSPNFIFKGKVKCSCSKKLYITKEGFLHCGNKNCYRYIPDEVIKSIIYFIVLSTINEKLSTGLKSFNNKLEREILNIKNNINTSNINKLSLLRKNLGNGNLNQLMNKLYDFEKLKFMYTNRLCDLRSTQLTISNLLDLIHSVDSKSLKNKEDISMTVTDLILQSIENFAPMLEDLVKEVKISTNHGKQLSTELNIKYEFESKSNWNLSKGIH